MSPQVTRTIDKEAWVELPIKHKCRVTGLSRYKLYRILEKLSPTDSVIIKASRRGMGRRLFRKEAVLNAINQTR